MKYAKLPHGKVVEANQSAPLQAICPSCNDTVILRSRRTMPRGVTYFWRHVNNQNRDCRARNNPIRWKDSRHA